ncbi:hypothetical protein [Rubrobacter xylanophilus]|uniref:hypothetical protein n=1 Tax=Rubrobacter xylanophilus TaxID=49319 RepID=UPI001C643BBD|nr:hypothetical protein [Rubrobacter xylanophilus]
MDPWFLRERGRALIRESEEARFAAALRGQRRRAPGAGYRLRWELQRFWGVLEKRLRRRMIEKGRLMSKVGARKRRALRPDTTLSPATNPGEEVYLWALPVCCIRTLKREVLRGPGERRRLELACGVCGRSWRITSSLDERVLSRFVTHAGPRAGGSHPAA